METRILKVILDELRRPPHGENAISYNRIPRIYPQNCSLLFDVLDSYLIDALASARSLRSEARDRNFGSAKTPFMFSIIRLNGDITPSAHTHNRFTALWILSGTTRVSRYQKKHSPTHTHRGHQSSPSTTIHGILPIQSTCFTVFFHNHFPSFLWSTSWSGTLHFILHTFLQSPGALQKCCGRLAEQQCIAVHCGNVAEVL